MKFTRNFIAITLADFIVRAAYQMGKTPLLPIFAATLGATDVLLGFIVSVSTLTGMVLKPLIGFLSDRWGQRLWLLIGTTLFAGVPFLYQLIDTPAQLVILRIFHGLSTAIYGPVTVAYVAMQAAGEDGENPAEALGWFGLARSGGYIVGPAVAGSLLVWVEPVAVFTVIGLMSALAFVPIWFVAEMGGRQEDDVSLDNTSKISTSVQFIQPLRQAVQASATTPAIWLAGGLDALNYIALYAVKAFLPLYELSQGANVVVVGLFFSVQEATAALLKPWGGRWGDRAGYRLVISTGMLLLGISLLLLAIVHQFSQVVWFNISTHALMLMGVAMSMGIGQALIFPATTALISQQIPRDHVGSGMGIVGAMSNAGKVIGPIIGGLLLAQVDYPMMFAGMGVFVMVSAVTVWFNSVV
ncbi:MAG: MFS transporter [Chloroflexota bacterium]